jgi:NADH:ubiquinone oxidoreductase subunit 5 (subunit L)/multisubunit Na+/H+ antiporter MnhA subunit
MLGLSVVAIIYGGFAALAQSDLKKLVAYSSVGHMGFATLGIFVLNKSGIEGALLVMINHGVTTGALFIAVGIIYERLHTRELDKTAGLGKFMPIFAAFLGVFCSGIAFLLWLRAVAAVGPARSGVYLYVEPFVTLALAWAMLDEPVMASAVAGGITVLIGVSLVHRSRG